VLATDTAVSDIVALLRSHRLFAETDLEALTGLVGRGQMLALREGDLLIRHGDDSEAAYVLVEGWARVRLDTGYGAVHLSTVSAPALVGEIGVFMGVPRTATIEAAVPLRALRIASADLARFGRENPAFLAAVMKQVGRRFQAFNNAIGFYSSPLAALRQHDFDLRLLDELKTPPAELADFTHSFRRLAEEIMERRAHREEMASASAIQHSMLPATIPAIAGVALDLFAHMLPAREVGGDFYDYLLLDDHHLAITIGDVSARVSRRRSIWRRLKPLCASRSGSSRCSIEPLPRLTICSSLTTGRRCLRRCFAPSLTFATVASLPAIADSRRRSSFARKGAGIASHPQTRHLDSRSGRNSRPSPRGWETAT
jgi:CRP-like cAMP-binding protein